MQRLENQVARYKSAAETAEKSEEELKGEKRKLQREVRKDRALGGGGGGEEGTGEIAVESWRLRGGRAAERGPAGQGGGRGTETVAEEC